MRSWLVLAALFAASVRAGTPAPADLGLPKPGSYQLDRIMPSPHGAVLDSEGRARRLAEFTTGKVTLFSFVYTACTDSRGCPLALAVMHTLKGAIEADPALRKRIRFVSLSFDPQFDTPEVMRSYGGAAGRPDQPLRWYFLTTRSPRQLAPLLAGFGQDLDLAGPGNRPPLTHLLKLYLIDGEGSVREIYSPAYLQPATILGDMRSLLLEQEVQGRAAWNRWPFQAARQPLPAAAAARTMAP